MSKKIVIISSSSLHKPVKDAFERLKPDCDLIFTTYDSFQDIPSVYDSYAEEADGFLVSGTMAKAAIEVAEHQVQKPILSFQIDLEGMYKSILDILMESKNSDMNRIIMDFMVLLDEKNSAADFLKDMTSEEFIPKFNQWITHLPAEEMIGIEDKMVDRLIQLYKDGKMDIVICQFTNIIPALIEHNIPYLYPFPSDLTLTSLLHELFAKIEMENLLANRSTLIYVAPRKSDTVSPETLSLLRGKIESFLKENLMECLILQYKEGFHIFTTVQVLDSITNHYRSCFLSGYLNESLSFECSVGYGIGNTLSDALKNSTYALREARFAGHSFIRNAQGDLIGPLDSDKRMVIENTSNSNQKIMYIAKKCKLSTITIQKLITYQKLTGSNTVTTQELSSRFGVTIRNANRILQNLQKGGYASVTCTKTSNSKGRPTKVYEFNFQ